MEFLPHQKPKAILCDIDGTLALLGDRDPYDASEAHKDALNHPVANILEVYTHQTLYDIKIILVTGREEKYRLITQEWLTTQNISYEALYMRPTGDFRKDTEIKKEIFTTHIKNNYDILFVLEDRDQVVAMWRRDLGLTCLQVEYGNF